ncbi:hypothetical protein D3C71_1259930 [compost metagenome]
MPNAARPQTAGNHAGHPQVFHHRSQDIQSAIPHIARAMLASNARHALEAPMNRCALRAPKTHTENHTSEALTAPVA